jgi:hypothetical protein
VRNLFLLCVLSIAFVSVSAQTSEYKNPPNIAVSKQSWSFKKNPDYTDLNTDVFKANDQFREFNRAVTDNARENNNRRAAGLPPLSPPSRKPISESDSPQRNLPREDGYYVYQIELKNSGEKTIRSVTWDYVFFETSKNLEAGRRTFSVAKEIRAGQTKTLSEKSYLYPTLTVDASDSDKKFHEKYSEKIFIKKIEYSDGSIWTAPSN